ncbi:low-specificity L-threonine aldolase [Alicyclobacillus ferrooxydans]|uniref:Threonine aldolase n=1 Tax=Alicyclobacillus ferrooxydans TaxID=471514 RepID=A0A0P9GSZ0_9BACL|nr:low-specificity L-threonine aldolase [Alicyclobacillus ferrooxydans]KPV44218.1 threonine aldolase [Alicyclobacillus ferrooxydans]
MGVEFLTGKIDLRSDTVTKPTEEMRKAMYEAEVGDDVYGEDPTVLRLEELAAELLGKEAALFVTSGTQGNQAGIATHASTGEEVIVEAQAHVFYYEAAAISVFAGAQVRQIPTDNGIMTPDQIRRAIRSKDVHQPRTALIAVENTHNRAGGTVWPLEDLAAVGELARRSGIPLHMDGARVFNAAAALGVPVRDVVEHVDTVSICLSKGLCAPVGSVLVGPRDFIERARQWRKRMGGGMRQAGVIAAPGIIALTKMVDRLAEDHHNARYLAEQLASMNGITVALDKVQTNIVIADIGNSGIEVPEFVRELAAEGVLASSFGETLVRFVTHHDVSRADIEKAVDAVQRVLHGARVH